MVKQETISKKELNQIKKDLTVLQKKSNCKTVMIKKYGIEFLYFSELASGRKNVYKAGIIKNGVFSTKE